MVEEASTVEPREEPRKVVDDIIKVAVEVVDDEEVVSAFDNSEDEDYWESSAEGAEDESYRESSTDIAEEEEYRESSAEVVGGKGLKEVGDKSNN